VKLGGCKLLNCFGIYVRLLIGIRIGMDIRWENMFDSSYLESKQSEWCGNHQNAIKERKLELKHLGGLTVITI
jgi:hypothetical protein